MSRASILNYRYKTLEISKKKKKKISFPEESVTALCVFCSWPIWELQRTLRASRHMLSYWDQSRERNGEHTERSWHCLLPATEVTLKLLSFS